MGQEIEFSVRKEDVGEHSFGLVLRALDGTDRIWRKQYDAMFFMSLDAEPLGLLERVAASGDPQETQLKLRPRANVDLEILDSLRFSRFNIKNLKLNLSHGA